MCVWCSIFGAAAPHLYLAIGCFQCCYMHYVAIPPFFVLDASFERHFIFSKRQQFWNYKNWCCHSKNWKFSRCDLNHSVSSAYLQKYIFHISFQLFKRSAAKASYIRKISVCSPSANRDCKVNLISHKYYVTEYIVVYSSMS